MACHPMCKEKPYSSSVSLHSLLGMINVTINGLGISCTMGEILINRAKLTRKRKGISLGFSTVDLMATLIIITLLCRLGYSSYESMLNFSKEFSIKVYLLNLRVTQSTHWLTNGTYLPLNALPQHRLSDVALTEHQTTTRGYHITATLNYKDTASQCRFLTIDENGVYPNHCWF